MRFLPRLDCVLVVRSVDSSPVTPSAGCRSALSASMGRPTRSTIERARMSGDPELIGRGKVVAERLAKFDVGGYPASDLDIPLPPEPAPDEPPRNGHPLDDDKTPVLADMLLNRSALRALPVPQPLIENTLDQGTTALLYGDRGTAKSFIAQDWVACTGTGRKWQGRPVAKRRGLYVAGEGVAGTNSRFEAWETGWSTQIHDDDLHVLPIPVNLTRVVDVANLAALISWGGYGFVVLDTLSRCMVGADENSAKDCGIVVDAMARLLDSTPNRRGVVLGVHHAGKDKKTLRGSSVFEAAADTVYFTARDGGVIYLSRTKRKDGPEHDRHELKLDPIPGTGSMTISVHRGVDKPERAEKLLSIFVHHFSQTGASKAELRKVADMPDVTFYRAVSDLLKCGDLINEGTDKRPFYKVADA